MLAYYLLALSMGFMVILNPILNGKLSEKIGTAHASFVNYATATVTALIALLLFQNTGADLNKFVHTPPQYYMGGILGICAILLFNRIVPKMPAVLIVVMPFVGQIAMSTLIDYFALGQFSLDKIIGALLMLSGLLANAFLDQRRVRTKAC